MIPRFYCQLDYERVSYPSPVNPRGNLADNGCGPICGSMLAENLLGVSFPPEESAAFALQSGARADVGTNLYVYSAAFAKKFALRLTETEDAEEMMAFLREAKGMVIANVRGNREGRVGVFSDTGHYVLVLSAEGDEIRVLDPMYRPGRYDIPGRAGKVRMRGNVALADYRTLRDDCYERPYFLFERP